MRHDIAIKWIEALRSDKYKQGQTFLEDEDDHSMCCLGVLQGPVLGLPTGDFQQSLSPKAQKLAGIETGDEVALYSDDDPHGCDFHGKRQRYLTGANDDGVSFDEIADFIEQNWEWL